jgi:hypothetical protein
MPNKVVKCPKLNAKKDIIFFVLNKDANIMK